MPVTKKRCRTSVNVPPSRGPVRAKIRPGPSSPAVATTWSGPVATPISQELSAKKTATKPTARNITRATTVCGRLVSSA